MLWFFSDDEKAKKIALIVLLACTSPYWGTAIIVLLAFIFY
jgi:hypothetical protein